MLIKQIFNQYRWRIFLTVALILIEASLMILFPLFIGNAIDGVLHNKIEEILLLGGLGFGLIMIGGFRRMFDSRFYAKIYTQYGIRTMSSLQNRDSSLKTARLNMLAEMIVFAEHQLPEIIQHSIGLLGILGIIAVLNFYLFILATFAGILVLIIYQLSSKKTIRCNKEFNDELEQQVGVIDSQKESKLKFHLLHLMKWNIKLSDLETVNYSASWLIMTAVLLSSIWISVSSGQVAYGALFALIMYVYQYIESIASLPLYYQNWLRLHEITSRLKKEE